MLPALCARAHRTLSLGETNRPAGEPSDLRLLAQLSSLQCFAKEVRRRSQTVGAETRTSRGALGLREGLLPPSPLPTSKPPPLPAPLRSCACCCAPRACTSGCTKPHYSDIMEVFCSSQTVLQLTLATRSCLLWRQHPWHSTGSGSHVRQIQPSFTAEKLHSQPHISDYQAEVVNPGGLTN